MRSTLETTSNEGTVGLLPGLSERPRLADHARWGVIASATNGGRVLVAFFQVQPVRAEGGDHRLRRAEELDAVEHRIHPAYRDAVVLVVRARVVDVVVIRRQDQPPALQARR